MPTRKPRIQVSLPPDTRQELQVVADALGTNVASLLARLAQDSLPTLRLLAEAAQRARVDALGATEVLSEFTAQINQSTRQLALDARRTSRRLRKKHAK